MGQARAVKDRLNEALVAKDLKTVEGCYAEDAVAVTPEQGEVSGRDAIVDYYQGFLEALSELNYEAVAEYEAGNVAIDEAILGGTHTGSIPGADGESIPATGRVLRVRACDVAVVEGGVITQHRFYSDQMEFLDQLGLVEPATSG